MPLLHLFLVAVIQGVTEFLPVSSSGHLILLPALTGMEDQSQVIDVAVHVGTLCAVMLYFRRDVALVLSGAPRLLRGQTDDPGARLAGLLASATLPVVIAGLIVKLSGFGDALRSVEVIGWATLIFGILLYRADQVGGSEKTQDDWQFRHALIMGLWQAIALIPGASRSGVTITGARFLGYARQDAAKLAMLMSIPTILASGVLLGGEVIAAADAATGRDSAIAAGFAFLAALAALSLMMRLLRGSGFTPYVLYRIGLGVVLLWVAYR